ncbi:MAG TPA: glycoside hydrolase family 3 N-terminal domain-containing protein [Gemmatimonadaceae bacterium]|jgi:beta-glucosidase-like glycosyl hydrolase|nr:glycoside hydrolase family 3 N-terminal domain-containing protein [Gemmatimonadaceae bacterium]
MREIARLLLPSIRWNPTLGMAAVRPAVERALDAGVGGFVLDGVPMEASIELTTAIRGRADEAPLLVMDPGSFDDRVGRRQPVALPPPAAIASLRDPHVVRRAARLAGRAVRRTGCNAMLGPSCNVAGAPVVESFGADASSVALAVAESVDAVQAEGVLSCVGDFPGTGRATNDVSALPTVRVPEDSLYDVDLVPFRAAIDAGAAAITMAAAAYPSLDARNEPAALSSAVIDRVLRQQLGFDGLVLADAALLERRVGRSVTACDLVAAGVDLVLRTDRLDTDLRGLLDAVAQGRVDRERVHDAARRRRERAELAGAPAPPDSGREDDAWLDELAERTIAVVRGRAVRMEAPIDVLVASDRRVDRSGIAQSLVDGVAQAGGDPVGVRHVHTVGAATRSTLVIVATMAPRAVRPGHGPSATVPRELAAVCADAREARREIVVLWCGHPDAAPASLDADLLVACWTASDAMLRAAGRWMMQRV